MKRVIKIIPIVLLVICLISMLVGCNAISSMFNKNKKTSVSKNLDDEREFYELTMQSKIALDAIAGDINNCWLEYIYHHEYESIDEAISAGMLMNPTELKIVLENDEKIKELYQKCKDGSLSKEIKAVMVPYNAYFNIVIISQGSYNTYSADMPPIRQELGSALRQLYTEI